MTRLMPHRSIMMPTIGTQTAENKPDRPAAPVIVARSHPNSPLTGFRKTPELNNDTGPLPTMSPIVEPTTIHHGLSNKRVLIITSPFIQRSTHSRHRYSSWTTDRVVLCRVQYHRSPSYVDHGPLPTSRSTPAPEAAYAARADRLRGTPPSRSCIRGSARRDPGNRETRCLRRFVGRGQTPRARRSS